MSINIYEICATAYPTFCASNSRKYTHHGVQLLFINFSYNSVLHLKYVFFIFVSNFHIVRAIGILLLIFKLIRFRFLIIFFIRYNVMLQKLYSKTKGTKTKTTCSEPTDFWLASVTCNQSGRDT